MEAQLKAWRTLLPGILEKFARIKDPRRSGNVRHKLSVLMIFGMVLFAYQCSSRWEANRVNFPALVSWKR